MKAQILLLFVAAATSNADVVSWNYDVYGYVFGPRVAGIEPVANWNNSYPDNPTTNLIDDSGTATTVDISYSSHNYWWVSQPNLWPGQDADSTFNKHLLNGYLNAGYANWGPPQTFSRVVLSQIDYTSYDIIVYFSSDVAGRAGDVTDGTTTYSFNTVGPASVTGANAVFAQTTDTGGTYATAANYAVFSGLSGASQTITVQMRDIDAWGGIAGFQIISKQDYATWIGRFPDVGALTGFNDDPDGDGTKNGIESIFGTNPGTTSRGIEEINRSGNTVTFRHPQSANPPTDITAQYVWSTGLENFHADGQEVGGTTVAFTTSPNTPSAGITTVTATITGTVPEKLFVSVKHSQPRWTSDNAWKWYRNQPWIVGFNFVPSTAANTTEFWAAETFDENTIDRELGWGAGLGFNSCRVFVQYLVWKHDPEGLKQRIEKFLSLATKRGLSTTLVLFDDCTFGDPPQTEPFLGKQRDPIPGMILPSWTPSPGLEAVSDRNAWPDLEKYIRDIVSTFARDPRVLMWDLYNEPGNSGMGNRSLPLVEATFAWARAVNPSQPLTIGSWGAPAEISRRQIELSDVVSFHFYGGRDGLRRQISDLKGHLRPVINTEWMARPMGSNWETDLPVFKKEAVGGYSWGLVNGRTQCQFAWYHKRGTPEPEVWFHDLFHPDGRPYDAAEHAAIRRITADKKIDWTAFD